MTAPSAATPTPTPAPTSGTGPATTTGRRPAPRATALTAVGTIAGSELRRTFRDRTALFFLVGLPLALILAIGSAFGGGDSLAVGVVDHDRSDASRTLLDGLAETQDVETYGSTDTLRRDIRAGGLGAGIVIPEGYGADLAAGRDVRVELIADPTSTASAAAQAAVRSAVGERAIVVAAARAVAGDAGDAATAQETAARVAEDLPRVGIRTVVVEDEGAAFGSFDYTAPANLVLFTFVNALVVGTFLARDRQQGILRRLLATPHGSGTILAGVGAAKFAVALVQSLVIVGAGALLFGVDWGDPLAVAALVVVFAVVATAAGLLIGAYADDPDQAAAVMTPVGVALGMLGGCMWPLEIVPPVMRAVGHVAPQAWAMDAWIEVVFADAGVADIARELAVLTAFALALSALAARALRRSLTA
ncbi:MAG TPA: ABC transporter permease [Acidimicrobiales bacterium]